MKSIKQQYIDLMEGKMSQHNFMRSLRMTLPQYVTNVTSFKDSVRILKNKGILSEVMGGDPIEATLKSYLSKGYSYAEAIEATAAEQGMDEEVLMSQYPQDAVDTEGYEDEESDEFIDMIAKAEEEEVGKDTKNYDFPGGLGEGDIDEAENTSLKNPVVAAKAIAQKYSTELKPELAVYRKSHNDYMQAIRQYDNKDPKFREITTAHNKMVKDFQNKAINLAGEEMLASGISKVEVRNLLSGYGYFEDWISDYIDTLTAELGASEDEMQGDDEFADMEKRHDIEQASQAAIMGQYDESLNEKSYKVSPNAISVSSLKKGDILGGSGLEVISISAGAKTPSGKIEVTVKDPKTGNEVTKVWNKSTKVTIKKDINEGKGKELHPNQIHPQELRMGIKVEMEHTDVLDKAKKIALDHLAENPFYYTALKLSGVESPSAPKVKAPKEAKKSKTTEPELVDKINAMKPVKGFEKAKASSNKAKKETNSGVKGVSELTHNAQSVRGLQKFAATGGKMKAVREGQLNEGEFTFNGTLTKDEIADLKKMIGDFELDVQEMDDTLETTISSNKYNDKSLEHASKQVRGMLPQKKQFGHTAGFGSTLQSKLESLVREVLDEINDGRDDMNAQYAEDEIK